MHDAADVSCCFSRFYCLLSANDLYVTSVLTAVLSRLQELVALQQRAAEGADGATGGPAVDGVVSGSPSGGGAWATVGKKNRTAMMRGEEDVQVPNN